jgi:hypothetical protein
MHLGQSIEGCSWWIMGTTFGGYANWRGGDVPLTNLEQVIVRCWNIAEEETAKEVLEKHYGPPEEFLTRLLAGELRSAFEKASKAGLVRQAFWDDLLSIPNIDPNSAMNASSHLVARVNFHNHHHEGKTSGSDLGLVIIRPVVTFDPYGYAKLELRSAHPRGLLAQAKLCRQKKGRSIWRGLKKNQQVLFPTLKDYYSLLLYRLSGENSNKLEPLRWQLCRNHSLEQVKQWLRSGVFPEEMSSSDVIQKLFARTIGIEDMKVLHTVIDPAMSAPEIIELEIYWPGGAPPAQALQLLAEETQQLKQRLRC